VLDGAISIWRILDAFRSPHAISTASHTRLQGIRTQPPNRTNQPKKVCRRNRNRNRPCSYDDYQIESSTDVCPCKKRCHFMKTQIFVSDEYLGPFLFVYSFFILRAVLGTNASGDLHQVRPTHSRSSSSHFRCPRPIMHPFHR